MDYSLIYQVGSTFLTRLHHMVLEAEMSQISLRASYKPDSLCPANMMIVIIFACRQAYDLMLM